MSLKEALRFVNGMTIKQTDALAASCDDAMLRRVCMWRRDEPVAYDEILELSGAVPLVLSMADVRRSERAQDCKKAVAWRAQGQTLLTIARQLGCRTETVRKYLAAAA